MYAKKTLSDNLIKVGVYFDYEIIINEKKTEFFCIVSEFH